MTPASLGPERLVGDRYVLEALIGRGGMGEVWRARHLALKTLVAIKFLQGATGPSERARRRFLTEAQVTANLKTRHAVQVFDFGVTDDGLPYLVMELLEGESLDKRIARAGRLPVATTSLVLQKAARALERAHALGIVHRDFKPENIMLVPDDEEGGELVKVVDFGIAKLVGDLDATLKCALGSIAQSRRTLGEPPVLDVTSGGVGTPYYMAPEQVQDSAQVGPASDIWAFGVVAYECLTGRRPFEDESIGKLLLRVLAAEPPVQASKIAPVPPLFDDWFRVACARSPGDRFPDVQTAATSLAIALETSVVAPVAPLVAASAIATPVAIPRPASPTLSSRQAPSTVSPLAATLDPVPRFAPASTSLASPLPAPRPVSLAPVALAPRVARALPALVAFVAAALALALAVRDVHGPEPAPVAMARAPDPAPSSPIVEAPVAPSPTPIEPAVATSRPAPDPPASPTTAPTSSHPRRPTSEARPSAYRLPPLGL